MGLCILTPKQLAHVAQLVLSASCGENIPFFGRIVAVADVFDAMVSGRAYSGFIDESDAIDKIQSEAELFDPEILKALVKAWENGRITQRTSTQSDYTDPS